MFIRLVSVSLLLGASPALAQTQPQRTTAAKSDPNRVICETIEQIGSRLATKRICMTAQQWAEKRRADREEMQLGQQKVR